jgi:hypothetical protein
MWTDIVVIKSAFANPVFDVLIIFSVPVYRSLWPAPSSSLTECRGFT